MSAMNNQGPLRQFAYHRLAEIHSQAGSSLAKFGDPKKNRSSPLFLKHGDKTNGFCGFHSDTESATILFYFTLLVASVFFEQGEHSKQR